MKDWSSSAWTAGFLAVLISYAGPLLILVQAAQQGNLPAEMLASWVWAVSLGAAGSSILLSWYLKVPIVTAWSAPGSALLLGLLPEVSMPEVVGAYLTAALLTVVIGLSGYFDRVVNAIPREVAAGMMAGILFQFGTQAFRASDELPGVVFAMLLAYLLGRRFCARHAVLMVALTGFLTSVSLGHVSLGVLDLVPAKPVFTWPVFNLETFLGLALPLLLVSFTGQYLPGIAVVRLAGYSVPSRAVVAGTGAASLLTACFGGISTVPAAITATLCTGKDAHPNPGKRYVAGIATGVFYLVGGTFAGTIVFALSALPSALVSALAGVALIGAIVANIRASVQNGACAEVSIITFLATASGMSIWGLGSAFWGVLFGLISYWMLGRPQA
ncbi:MAG: benzoate/H(+) symporter BenE family transporter [Lautropia sp.]|nr:benzoate/H(+) symporter BenE family transporter [Lautropia sp.]